MQLHEAFRYLLRRSPALTLMCWQAPMRRFMLGRSGPMPTSTGSGRVARRAALPLTSAAPSLAGSDAAVACQIKGELPLLSLAGSPVQRTVLGAPAVLA